MDKLSSYLFSFASVFKNAVKKIGEGVFVSFSGENRRVRVALDALDKLERVPLLFVQGRPSTAVAKERLAQAHAILAEMRGETSDLGFELKRKAAALSYRLGRRWGGDDPLELPDKKIFALLSTRARKAGYLLAKDKTKYLAKAARYPLFSELLLSSDAFLESFFNWSLRDSVAPDVFIQYPELAKTLQEAFLAERIGIMGKKSLKIKLESFDSAVLKDVVLFFEGKEVSILDKNERVRLSGEWTLKLDEVWEIFKKKKSEIGDLEFLKNGIANWNSFFLGKWNDEKKNYELVDITQSSWWKQLPFVEVLTLNEAEERYGYRLDGTHWNIAATATRLKKNLDYNGSHAFFELAMPLGDGKYAVYPFGKFAKRFPTSFLDGLSYFGHTVPATVACPDPNVFYTDRKRAWQSFAIEKEYGYRFLEEIRKEILRSRQDSAVYQIESENCAKWTQEILENILGKKAVPELYRMSLLDTQPGGIMERIFALLKKLPEPWGVRLFALLHYPLKPWVGTSVWKEGKRVFLSLINTHFWETSSTHLPGMLHEIQTHLLKTPYFFYVVRSFEKFYTDFLSHRLKKELKKQGGRIFVLNSGEKALNLQFLGVNPPFFRNFLNNSAFNPAFLA